MKQASHFSVKRKGACQSRILNTWILQLSAGLAKSTSHVRTKVLHVLTRKEVMAIGLWRQLLAVELVRKRVFGKLENNWRMSLAIWQTWPICLLLHHEVDPASTAAFPTWTPPWLSIQPWWNSHEHMQWMHMLSWIDFNLDYSFFLLDHFST